MENTDEEAKEARMMLAAIFADTVAFHLLTAHIAPAVVVAVSVLKRGAFGCSGVGFAAAVVADCCFGAVYAALCVLVIDVISEAVR